MLRSKPELRRWPKPLDSERDDFMSKLRYIPWAVDDLGITFTMRKGRIQIFKKTLEKIQFPEYCHFLFNTVEKTIAIQACDMDDKGAHRLIVDTGKRFRCEVNCTNLVRFVYQTCGWDEKYSYRILGTPRLEEQLIKYDLKLARKVYKERTPFHRIGRGKVVAAKFPVR